MTDSENTANPESSKSFICHLLGKKPGDLFILQLPLRFLWRNSGTIRKEIKWQWDFPTARNISIMSIQCPAAQISFPRLNPNNIISSFTKLWQNALSLGIRERQCGMGVESIIEIGNIFSVFHSGVSRDHIFTLR
jgi:hypothetical protein